MPLVGAMRASDQMFTQLCGRLSSETRAARTHVNVGRGGLPWNRPRKGVIGDFSQLKILPQPEALRTGGDHGYVHAPAMIESQGAMHLGLAFSADRKRTIELAGER